MTNRKMRAYLLKGLLSSADALGRRFLYNREPPPSGEMTRDAAYGPHPQQRLDIIRPPQPEARGSVIFMHGGGWIIGNKASYTRVCRTWASQGYLVFNLDYRLAPRFAYRDQLQDLADGIALAYEEISRSSAAGQPIFLSGDSAGAHMMSWYAAAQRSPALFAFSGVNNAIPADAVHGLLLFYGLYDLESALTTSFPGIRTFIPSFLGASPPAEAAGMLSPLRHIHADFPASFICVSEIDPLLPENTALRSRLEAAGVKHTFHLLSKKEYPQAYHGFLNHYYAPFAQEAMQASLDFMEGQTVLP